MATCILHTKDTCACGALTAPEQLTLALTLPAMAETKPSPPSWVTVGAWGARWIEGRETSGFRGVGSTRSIWSRHVAGAPWCSKGLAEVTPSDARAWWLEVCGRKYAGSTLKNVLAVPRRLFQEAFEAGLIESNPFRGLRVPRVRFASMHEDDWTTRALTVGQQAALLLELPEPERWIVAFGMGTGLRKGEQWALRLDDVRADNASPFVVVRRGSFDGPTKAGRVRRVPLFGLARDAWAGWSRSLPHYALRNPHGLAFPSERGDARKVTRAVRGWRLALRRARVPAMRWHDLRHTCGTSLVNGWWGPAWTLEEVRALLGHASVVMTERYARIEHTIAARAADRMRSRERNEGNP